MAVLSISRDWGVEPAIVRMTVDDSLAEITTTGYLTGTAVAASIEDLNSGAFEWLDTDIVLIKYDTSWGFFTRNATNNDFEALASPGGLTDTLNSGNVFVGNASNLATGVTMSGDATMANTGALTIANNAVTSAKTSPLLLKYVAVPISSAEFLGMYAAPKLLVAAGGANTIIVPRQAQLLLTYNSAAYAAGGTAAIQWDSTVNGAGVIASTTMANTLFQGTVSAGFNMNPGVVTETFTTTVNKGLYLSNISGAFTTGNSAFVLHLWYAVIPTV